MPKVNIKSAIAPVSGNATPFERAPRPGQGTPFCHNGSVVAISGCSAVRRGVGPRFADGGPSRVEANRLHQTPANDQRPRVGALVGEPVARWRGLGSRFRP